jgi:hypothetical protein
LEALDAWLELHEPEQVRVNGAPNARLTADLYRLRAIDGGGWVAPSVDPEHAAAVAKRRGYQFTATWSGTGREGELDLILAKGNSAPGTYRAGAAAPRGAVARGVEGRPGAESARGGQLANVPARFRDAAALMRTLRGYVGDKLPAYMVPAAFVPMERLPVNPAGKLDRAALPAPDFGAMSSGNPPGTPREKALCAAAASVLGLVEVGVDDDFFALGGDSISSIQLVIEARSAGLGLSTRQVFELRTCEALAVVAADVATTASGSGDAMSLVELSQDEIDEFEAEWEHS